MAPRTRSRSTTISKGTWERFGVVNGGGTLVDTLSTISDQTGPGDCAPLDISSITISGGVIQSENRLGFNTSYFDNYTCDYLDNHSNFAHPSFPGALSDVAAATSAAARTSPSRPYVDVPVMLFELGDITRLLQITGKNLLQTVGRSNLAYNFGIAPLVGDLVKLLRFQDQVERRIKEIDRLVSKKGLRRTVEVATYNADATAVHTVQSQGLLLDKTFNRSSTLTMKVHCRWLPQPHASLKWLRTTKAQRALAKKAVLGLTVDFSTAWELIPFSWLIDWGYSMGQYLAAQRNIIPATLSGVHVMRHTRSNWRTSGSSHTSGSGHKYHFSAVSVVKERKLRAPSFVAPIAHFPFLSGKQMGIVASLAVARR